MAYLSVTGYTTNSISVQINGLEYPIGDYGGFRFKLDSGSWVTKSTISHTFTGLTSGTDYSFSAEGQWNGTWYPITGTTGHTGVIPPSISLDTRASTWIQVITVENDSPGYLETFINGVSVSSSGYSYSRNGNYLLVGGLTPNTTYSFYCKFTKNGYSASSSTIYVTTLNVRPSDFSWTNAVFSTSKFYLPATEWNSFTSRINSFRAYKGLSSYTFTNAIYKNDFTATMFNQARTAISAMGASVPSAQSSGNDIYVSYMNGLVSALNSIQ